MVKVLVGCIGGEPFKHVIDYYYQGRHTSQSVKQVVMWLGCDGVRQISGDVIIFDIQYILESYG